MEVNKKILLLAPGNLDPKMTIFDTVGDVLTYIPEWQRERGMIVKVVDGTTTKEYWWPTTDLSDLGLVARPDFGDYVEKDDLFLTNRQRGFYAPNNDANVVLAYDATARTITMTGDDVRATDNTGTLITETIPTFISGWVSPAHPSDDEFYVLSYNGTDIAWRTVFNFNEVLIAIKPKGFPACTREPHTRGVSIEDHAYHHYGDGTIFQKGAEISNVVIDSFTAAERRPYIADMHLNDDGLITLLPALNTNSYVRFYLSATETTNYDAAQIDIIEVGDNNRPYYYDRSTGDWVKTLIPRITTGTSESRQRFCSVWGLAVPTTKGDNASYRHIFIQPQGFSTSLNAELARNPAEVLLGVFGNLIPEYVLFHQFIIRYKPDEDTGDWNIAAKVAIRGTRAKPVSLAGIGAMSMADQILAASTKETPADADVFGYVDAVSSLLQKFTWANLKAALKAYFDTVYAAAFGTLTITTNATTWDLSSGLKKKVSASDDFTLTISNPSDGQCGILTINATADLTLTLNTGAVYTLFEGSLTLTTGIYVLALIYNGDFMAINILNYPEL
jgi:hypothetical protein